MVSLRLECDAEQKDELIAALWENETLGVTEVDLNANRVGLTAFFDAPFDAAAYAAYGARWEEEPEVDWAAETRARWPGFAVGERFWVAPPWNEEPTPEGRVRLVINPGVGFGTGADLTTQLCLEALERELRTADTVFDFGTGSGILALAAQALGARAVLAADIDLDAVLAAREDLPAAVGLFVGSIRSVRDASVDVLLANLNAETIANHAAEMRRVLRPGGRVIISGVPPRHGERVVKALTANGIPPREVHEQDIWLRIVC
ncbi:MAG: 50S ribosomal protein L11 methyltransferase [Bryobacterales bacterium]|nr:50S ribosomal protein L11 methyltransferase [Bryobacterales bacterium]